MHRIVQISDTHFGTETQPVVAALRSQLNSLKPDLLVCSGDITQRARSNQFNAASTFLSTLEYGDLLCVPGNHDMPLFNVFQRLFDPYSNYNQFVGSMRQKDVLVNQTFSKPGLVVVGVNSCNPFHYKNGRLKHRELENLEAALKNTADETIKLVVAHHPFDAIQVSDEENIMPNAQKLLARFGELGVDMVLGGHIHYQFCRTTEHRYPDLKKPIGVCQAGTTLSSRVRAGLPNSFMELQVHESKSDLTVTQWEYIEGQGAFAATTEYQPFRKE